MALTKRSKVWGKDWKKVDVNRKMKKRNANSTKKTKRRRRRRIRRASHLSVRSSRHPPRYFYRREPKITIRLQMMQTQAKHSSHCSPHMKPLKIRQKIIGPHSIRCIIVRWDRSSKRDRLYFYIYIKFKNKQTLTIATIHQQIMIN